MIFNTANALIHRNEGSVGFETLNVEPGSLRELFSETPAIGEQVINAVAGKFSKSEGYVFISKHYKTFFLALVRYDLAAEVVEGL